MPQNMKDYHGEDEIISSHDFYKKVAAMPPEQRYMFGISSIDYMTEGFAHGDLIVITGYTGHGKTTFCQTVAYNLGQKDIPTLWFSFELSARQFFNKYKDKTIPLFYLPSKNKPYDMLWLQKKIIEAKEKFKVKVVFIDHLHYITPMLSGEQRKHEVIGDIMRELKIFTAANDIAVFIMAHTGKPKDDLSPTLADIRDSSFVAQEADAVYSIHRPAKRGRHGEVEDFNLFTIIKQRHNGNIGKPTKLEIHNQMFYDKANLTQERAL
jgi:replicative DNA helicase